MFERRFLPAVVVLLVALLVLVVALWAADRAKFSDKTVSTIVSDKQTRANDLAASGVTYKWKLIMAWPKNLPGLGSAGDNFARYVNEMSGGRIQVKVFGAGEIVPAFEVFDAVSKGVAQVGHSASSYWKGKIPAAVFFTTVPFGMAAQEVNSWLHYGGGLDLWRRLYAPYGVVPFAGGNTGTQMAGWFNRELNSISDLKGLKMRITGLSGEVFDAAGGTAVRIAAGEIYTSMQTGVIDAVEWVGPYNDRILGLNEVARYYYYPAWHEPGPVLEFIINEKALNSLPADLQAIVRYATRVVNQDVLDEFTARNHESLRKLLDTGTELRRLPDDVIAELYEKTKQTLKSFSATDPLAVEIADSYAVFAQNVRAYHDIAEGAYFKARAKVLLPESE